VDANKSSLFEKNLNPKGRDYFDWVGEKKIGEIKTFVPLCVFFG